jgi:hypothetical protein
MPAVNPNSNPKVTPTALDVARPLAGNMDQAIIEAAAGMGAVVTELMRRILRGGVLTVGEQLGSYVGECVDLTIKERRPVIEQTAYATAAKVIGEEVCALEQRTTEATRGLAGQIEEKAQRLPSALLRPNRRSLRIGSLPFQRARAKQRRCLSSEMPARPSSPQW